MVEAALVLPICLLILLGIFEYSRLFLMRNVLANAAREGARYAVIHTADKTTADVQAVVTDYLANTQVQLSGYTVSVYPTDNSGAPLTGNWNDAAFGSGIGVKVEGDYQVIVGNLLLLPGSLHLTAISIMTSEGN